MRIEYEQRIETCFQRVKYICLRMWMRDAKYVREINELEKIKRELVQYASKMLMQSCSQLQMSSLNATIEKKFQDCDEKYSCFLEQMFETNEGLEKKLITCYNQHLKNIKHNAALMNAFERILPIQASIRDWCFDSREYENSWFSFSRPGYYQLKRLLKSLELKRCDHSTTQKKRHAFVQLMMSIVDEKIIPEVNGRIDKPFVYDTQVRYAFNTVYKHLFVNQQSPIAHCSTSNTLHQFNMEQLTRDVLALTFSAMLDRYLSLRGTELHAKRDEYGQLRTRLKARIDNDVKCMHDSNESGQNVAIQVVASVIELLVKDSGKRAHEQISRVIFHRLKNPEELIGHAFKRSFEALDYQAVYKYVRDVVGYCTEVSEELTAPRVKGIIDEEKKRLEENVQLVIHAIIRRLKRNAVYTSKTIYSFLDELRKTSKSVEDNGCSNREDDNEDENEDEVVHEMIERVLSKCKLAVVDGSIRNVTYFQSSFDGEIGRQASALQLRNIAFNDLELEEAARKHNRECLTTIMGCDSTCPGCGTKCNKSSGHTDPHSVNKHLFNGFGGWSIEETNVVCVEYCWQNSLYLNDVIVEKVSYESFKKFLEIKHQKWVADLKLHNKTFESGAKQDSKRTKAFLDSDFYIKKSWMNVRKRLIAEYRLVDQSYEKEWLDLEDTNNMLLATKKKTHPR